MLEHLVVADDLSGAAESAAAFLLRTTRISVLLGSTESAARDSSGMSARVVALDTDSRHLGTADAGEAVTRCVAQVLTRPDGTRVTKKVDSLLRGNIAAEVRALATVLGATPVVATALPSAGRTVVDGIPLVHGEPLAATKLWAAEEGDAPRTVGDALVGLHPVTVPLAVVRDAPRLHAALSEAAQRGWVPVCDAETDADLDAVVAATSLLENILLVGSAALVAAEARALLPEDEHGPAPADEPTGRVSMVLAVIGSAAPAVAAQVSLLGELGLPLVRLDPRQLLTSPSEARQRVQQVLTGAGLVVTLDQTMPVDPAASRRLSAALASAAEPATSRATVLLATGGETARAVLSSLGVHRMTPVAVHEGVVRSLTSDGLVVFTRPGSHGGVTSLHDALAPYVAPSHGATPTEPAR